MVESLEQMVGELNAHSDELYFASAELKKMLVEKLESEKQAISLVNYVKNINLANAYEKVRQCLIKGLAFAESEYSEKYNYFLAANQSKKLKEMDNLLTKTILLEKIKAEIDSIKSDKLENKNTNLPNYLDEKSCIGGCGYSGEFKKNDDELPVCPNCAVIQEEKYFMDQEKRAYTSDEINSRRRTEPRWRNFGPRTVIKIKDGDGKGHALDPEKAAQFNRLSKIQNSLVNSLERNYWESKPKMADICAKLNLPEHVAEDAWKIYCEAAKQKLTMGRTIEGFVAASIYASIMLNKIPKSLEEVIAMSSLNYRTVVRSLGMIKVKVLPKLNVNYAPISPQSFVYKFGNELKISPSVQQQAADMLSYTLKHGLKYLGKDPKGLAAAALYLMTKKTKEKKSQAKISKCAKITEVTLRAQAKQIKLRLKRN